MSRSQSDHSTVRDKLYPSFIICHHPATVFLVLNTLHYTPVKRWMENMELDFLDEQKARNIVCMMRMQSSSVLLKYSCFQNVNDDIMIMYACNWHYHPPCSQTTGFLPQVVMDWGADITPTNT